MKKELRKCRPDPIEALGRTRGLLLSISD